jgi:transcriptional antiterminator RfaH
MKRWYLVYCKPRGEELAKSNLERQGFETYLPLVRQPRRRMGRRIMCVEPLFPRYLFIHLDAQQDNWAPIRSTLGVTSLVRFGAEPAVVPVELIDMLRAREDAEGIQDLPPVEPKPGERIRIVEGPMSGYEGVLLARTSRERVVVLLDIVGRKARAKVDLSHLEPVK